MSWLYRWCPLIPHAADPAIEQSLDLLIAYNIWEVAFVAAGLGLLLATKKQTSILYTRPLAWLSIFYALTIFGGLQLVTVFLIWGSGSWFIVGNFTAVTYILGAIASVKAAEAFSDSKLVEELPHVSVGEADMTFFGKITVSKGEQTTSCVDVITYLANLASDRQAIDLILDKLRTITSNLQPNQPIPKGEQIKLAGICKELKDFSCYSGACSEL